MPKKLTNCHVLCMNVDLEYQKSEVASGFFYNSANQRQSMVDAERKWVDDRTQLILDLKNKACKPGETMVIINQKGIDPLALDMLAREGILALRRAKRRNMERVCLACGGESINSLDMLGDVKILGFAERIEEQTLEEETYTFIEGVKNPFSCTVLALTLTRTRTRTPTPTLTQTPTLTLTLTLTLTRCWSRARTSTSSSRSRTPCGTACAP